MQSSSNFIRLSYPVFTVLVCSLTIFNLSWVFFVPSNNHAAELSAADLEFSWVGDDFPEFWQVDAPEIAMVVEETSHYTITGMDAKEEWATNSPAGFGYLRVGPENRYCALNLAHQLHCLRILRGGLAGERSPKMLWHFQHCINFIRMMVLCHPNLTLEPADVLDRDFEIHRTGATHVCRDWRLYFEKMQENWDNFLGNRSSIYES